MELHSKRQLSEPMRWAQLTLTEDDPANFDLEFWLDTFKQTHAEGACLSAGGYVAYYPTEIPLHHRSTWLGDQDPFGDLVKGCREMNMSVIARTDPHAVHQDAADAHPDWIAVDMEGQPRRHWSTPSAWVTCALGPYNFNFMTKVHQEIVSLYNVDGIFSNRWAGHGLCYCEHCQRNFRDYCGLDLPRDRSLENPSWRAYHVWRQERLFELIQRWDSAIQEVKPTARYIPNSGGGALSQLDMVRLSEMTPLLFADRQGRHGILPAWANGKNAKEFRAAYGSKPIGGMFSVGLEERHRWKDSVQSDAELRVWIAGAIANGMRPWYTKFCGKVFDKRWLNLVSETFDWHWRNERYFRNTQPLARVGLVYSQQSAAWYGGEQAQEKVEDPSLGMYQALVEARIPFEMVHDRLLDQKTLENFKVLVLPNIACLSDLQCKQLAAFVEHGGGLVATWETSLYTEEGQPRDNFGLADLMGISQTNPVEGPLKNTYLNLEHSSPFSNILLNGLENANRIIHGAYRVPIKQEGTILASPLTLVPPYPDLPMEEVYPRQQHTDIPGLLLRQVGDGRAAYFPWDIARTFWEVLNPDLGCLLANAVTWALNEPPIIEVQGSGLLDITVWKQEDSLTIHLVNLTNPMLMRGAFRQVHPIGPLDIHFRPPEGTRVKMIHLLTSGQQAPYTHENEVIRIHIPTLQAHEVVAFDLE